MKTLALRSRPPSPPRLPERSVRSRQERHVVVVGGGASGVLLAVHLLRDAGPGLAVTIVERRPTLGAGIAYATNHDGHLLNVCAAKMSAFADDPDHFHRWLRDHAGPGTAAYTGDSFVPRRLFRDYLTALHAPLLANGQLRHLRTEALAVRPDPAGVRVETADGAALRADVAVIATGNEGPCLPPEPWRREAWTGAGGHDVAASQPVVMIGTGLTMVDCVLSLLDNGHAGPITAVSRRGLAPQAHRPTVAQPLAFRDLPRDVTLSALMRWVRGRARAAEASGAGWRSFIDSLRPHTQALWRALPPVEQRRFLRHAKPFWDVHRHRIAPEVAQRLDAATACGQITIKAARVAGFDPRESGVDVHLTRRRTGQPDTVHAETVLECRGRSPDVTRTANPLLLDLLRRGTAVPDALRLGLAVAPNGAVIDARGQSSDRIFALGPITAGTFWEIVAVPDIRQHAQALAATLKSGIGHAGVAHRARESHAAGAD